MYQSNLIRQGVFSQIEGLIELALQFESNIKDAPTEFIEHKAYDLIDESFRVKSVFFFFMSNVFRIANSENEVNQVLRSGFCFRNSNESQNIIVYRDQIRTIALIFNRASCFLEDLENGTVGT